MSDLNFVAESEIASRQTGHTSRQMLAAPLNSVFVWCSSHLAYPNALAHELERHDLLIVGLSWLDLDRVSCVRRFPGVVIDHFARLDSRHMRVIHYLRDRGTVVTTA